MDLCNPHPHHDGEYAVKILKRAFLLVLHYSNSNTGEFPAYLTEISPNFTSVFLFWRSSRRDQKSCQPLYRLGDQVGTPPKRYVKSYLIQNININEISVQDVGNRWDPPKKHRIIYIYMLVSIFLKRKITVTNQPTSGTFAPIRSERIHLSTEEEDGGAPLI